MISSILKFFSWTQVKWQRQEPRIWHLYREWKTDRECNWEWRPTNSSLISDVRSCSSHQDFLCSSWNMHYLQWRHILWLFKIHVNRLPNKLRFWWYKICQWLFVHIPVQCMRKQNVMKYVIDKNNAKCKPWSIDKFLVHLCFLGDGVS